MKGPLKNPAAGTAGAINRISMTYNIIPGAAFTDYGRYGLQLLLQLMAVLILMSPAAGGTEIIDRVAAIVNHDVITLHDLNEEGEEVFRRIRQEAPPAQQEATIRKARQEILEGLIERKLVEQRAAEIDISVTENEVEMAIHRLLEQNNVSHEQFLHELLAIGTTEAKYRERLRAQILQSKLIGFEVRSRIVITDRKVKEYYNRHFAGRQQDEGYHILQMGFTWKGQGASLTREEARQRAEKIREIALTGLNFPELVETHSDLPSARDGGDIGIVKEGDMAPHMREAIVNLQPGEISQVVATESDFQFFKLLSVRKGDIIRTAPFEQVKNDLKEKVYQEEVGEQFEIWLRELRADAYIKKLL
jgi:peptidyl-prolyl cis-trans isomerase SurA